MLKVNTNIKLDYNNHASFDYRKFANETNQITSDLSLNCNDKTKQQIETLITPNFIIGKNFNNLI